MTLRDQIELAIGNLWRVKLRAILTISGVVIAIATFVAMLSFAAGNKQRITERFNEFGLFTTILVYPERDDDRSDTTEVRPLDQQALHLISQIRGVELVYPYEAFEVTASVADTQVTVNARALPGAALKITLFSRMLAGDPLEADNGNSILVTSELMEDVGVTVADSLVGREIVLTVFAPSLDSAFINIIDDGRSHIWRRLKTIRLDSMLFVTDYRRRVIGRELNEGVRRFIDGYMNRRLSLTDTFVICGVAEHVPSRRARGAPVYIPAHIAQRYNEKGYGGGTDPTDLLAIMQRGSLFPIGESDSSLGYSQATVHFDAMVAYRGISDSIKALGFRTFSYAEQFEEIQRFFLYFSLLLGFIGLVALVTAGLGIINTMVMSIVERRREIGIIKSLGADEREIRFLFLVESAVIGAVGSGIGILCGWIATRITAAVIAYFMRREGVPVIDPFALPFWLIMLALAFGIVVSMLAGLYPAARAARVDPVEALRGE